MEALFRDECRAGNGERWMTTGAGAPNVEEPAPESCVCTGPREKASCAVGDFWRRPSPVDQAVLLPENWCVGGLFGILLYGRRVPVERTDEQIRARGREPRTKLKRGFGFADLRFPLEQHGAGVEPRVDSHSGDAGSSFAVCDGPLDGCGTAILGQQRRVDIDDAARRDVDDRLRNDLAVAYDDHRVGTEGGNLVNNLRAADAFGLVDGKTEAKSGLLDGRCCAVLASAGGAVRLGVDGRDGVAGGREGFEGGHGEVGGAQKEEGHSQSPDLTSLRILRRIRSRLRALTCVM